jgi:hypothetical protein
MISLDTPFHLWSRTHPRGTREYRWRNSAPSSRSCWVTNAALKGTFIYLAVAG